MGEARGKEASPLLVPLCVSRSVEQYKVAGIMLPLDRLLCSPKLLCLHILLFNSYCAKSCETTHVPEFVLAPSCTLVSASNIENMIETATSTHC